MSTNADLIRWNIWELNAKGQRVKWLGQVTDPETGFAWLKKQSKAASRYVINNVPPSTSKTRKPTMVYQGLPTGEIVKTGEVVMPSATPVAPKSKTKRLIPSNIDNSNLSGDVGNMATRKASVESLGVTKRGATKKSVVDKALAENAKGLLAQHMADEQRDLEEGRIQPV